MYCTKVVTISFCRLLDARRIASQLVILRKPQTSQFSFATYFCCATRRLSPHRNERSIGPHFSSGILLRDLNKTACPFPSCLLRAYVHLLRHFLIHLTALLENYNCTARHCAIPSLPFPFFFISLSSDSPLAIKSSCRCK